MELKEKIIKYSKHIGIDLIGFTDAGPFEDLRRILIKRKEEGKLSGFEEKDIELRLDPKKTLYNAESIIVIAMSYYMDESKLPKHEKPRFYGQLARMAWGKDYHIVLMDKLEKLAQFMIKEFNGFEYKTFVDTGPLVDRYLANRAGIGFYGYNSMLINEGFGSWIFLGYMITNIPLPKDGSLKDKSCLGCDLCIKYCPTSAIEGAYKFNSGKCLSNLLQQKNPIPKRILTAIGNKIYGCDICQNVCPHNVNIKEATTKKFIPQKLPDKVDLIRLLQITNTEFNFLFGENASAWRGKKTIQRNAIIALGNFKDKDAIPYLIPLLKDTRLDIRDMAIWALHNIDSKIAEKLIPDLIYNKTMEAVRHMGTKANKIIKLLSKEYPNAKCELNYKTPFQLLVATILSAQTTDKKVNEVTESLFKEYPTLDDFLLLTRGELEEKIKKIGLYRNKSKHILLMCRQLKEQFDGEVPHTLENLMSLAGVGRKTANVVLSNAFGIPAIAIDTHVFRVSNRIGLANSKNVLNTELQLQDAIDKKLWSLAHRLMVYHGRRCCYARNPNCSECIIKEDCNYYETIIASK